MRRVWALLPVLLLGAAAALGAVAGVSAEEAPADDSKPEITRKELKEHVKVLSHDDWEGREAGEPGSEKAADYIAAEFARLGLQPVGSEGSWFEPFTSPKGSKVLPSSSLEAFDAKGASTAFKLAVDFTPVGVSAAGEIDAEVAFVGYSIEAPRLGGGSYQDYAGIDVKGKVVLALRRAPRWQDKKRSPFAQQSVMMKHGTFKAKADAAAAAGAVALIVMNDPASTKKSDDKLNPPGGSTTGKIPVLHMTWQAAKRLGTRVGLPFLKRQRAIDGKLTPRSEVLAGVRIRLKADLAADIRKMKNICALLTPGGVTTGAADAGPRETVVVGAHYDHVGRGRFGSLAKANGEIHNGADDNASGTAALMEIAGYLHARRGELKRRVLFIAFSGEELGLLGSKHYARNPVLPIKDCVAMLNLDMVGRLTKNRLFVGGTGTSPIWPEMMERLNKRGRFDLTTWPGGKAPSDHTSFYEVNVPVLFFFTDLHGDYHRPSDDWNTLEYKGHERVARFAASVALELATRDERPQFTRCDAGGFRIGPYSGLAVEQRADGVYVAHVKKKSPASKAGFKKDDKILRWEKGGVADTGRWNALLSKAKPGDKVVIEIERKGRTRKLTLKLEKT